MPSDKKNISKKEKSKDKRTELLKELAEKLKQSKKESPKDLELGKKRSSKESNEKQVDELNKIPAETESRRALRLSEDSRSSPILEAIAGEQSRPVFVNNQRRVSAQNLEEEKDVGYAAKPGADNEPKYSSGSSSQVYNAERVQTERLGRSGSTLENPRVEFRQDERSRNEQSNREKPWTPERFDPNSLGRNSRDEMDEVKYKKYEPVK
ncbi:MAG: hypothetical protein Q8P81_02885 [Nanoarchaeota archaeon]|nr:hypothetical protein [Nanoarchaeota archaeon]